MLEPQAPEHITWPSNLDAQGFLNEYWQKKPLLIKQAFPNFETPISPDELAGLSLEDDTTPRLITQDNQGQYHLEHGPFAENRFETLDGNDWSLLVTDVEKHCPELVHYLKPFQFIPDWRIDDLMISYAPDGASVGAHVDEYDVFLLQASGTRQWLIDAAGNPDLTIIDGASLQILENFNPSETHELQPGDMLYLPPGVPHHGIATGDDCTTWSIGFRAPVLADVVVIFAEMLAEKLGTARYKDPSLSVAKPGQLDQQTLQAFATLWKETTTIDDEELATLTAKALTTPTLEAQRESFDAQQMHDSAWRKHPFSRFAYMEHKDGSVNLYADAQAHQCSLVLASQLCSNQAVHTQALDKRDLSVMQQLMLSGSLYPLD